MIPDGVTYVDDSTGITYVVNSANNGAIADDASGSTTFPFDEGGYNIGTVEVGESATVSFQMQINDPYDGAATGITNSAQIDSDEESFTVEITASVANNPSATLFTDSSFNSVSTYNENEDIYIQVTDLDYSSDSTSGDTIEVTVINNTTGDREIVTLTETNDTGVFTSTTPLASSISLGQGIDDDTLYALAEDSLTVSYTDAAFSSDTSSDTETVSAEAETKILYLSDANDLDRIDPVNSNPVDTTDSTSDTLTTSPGGSPSELFISEYVEGSSNNKAIEIFNGTGAAVDLSNYTLEFYFNGNTSVGRTFNLSGTVADGDVFVFAHSSAVLGITADQTSGGSFYNGNDAIVLKNNGTVVDAIGQVGTDPGSEWGTGNTSTENNTIRRQSSITAGDTVTNDTFDPSLEWDGYAQDTFDGLGSHSINTGSGSTSTTFTQAIPFEDSFTMPADGEVKVTTYIDATVNDASDDMPANPNVTAVLKEGGVTFATLTNPNYNSGAGTLTWTDTLTSAVTASATEAIELEITTAESADDFVINYDSDTYPSKIELPTSTVIEVTSLGIYDDTSANGGSLIDSGINGDTVYIRAEVTDPFGEDDITGLDVVIDLPDGSQTTVTLDDTYDIDGTADDNTRIYEYAWQTGTIEGTYDISVTANEGYETGNDAISDSAGTTFDLSALDLGTPSTTEFVDVSGNPVDTYSTDATVYLQITDLDENTGSGTAETITATITTSTGDTENVTLTETGLDTGIFQVNIAGLSTGAGTGQLDAPDGTTLSVSYTDADNSLDISEDTASVFATPPTGNTAPVATDDTNTVTEDATLNVSATNGVIQLSGNEDTDADLDTLTVVSVDGTSVNAGGTTITLASGAEVTMNPDGSYDYDPDPSNLGNFDYLSASETATDSFTYTISDGNGGFDTATVTITITGVNDAPTAVNDSFTTTEATAINLSASAITSNDSDLEGNSLTIDSIAGSATLSTPNSAANTATTSNNGTITFEDDVTITYNPDAGFSGVDTFDYTISDGNGGTATATISITVEAAPELNLDPNNDSGGTDDGNFETTYSYSPISVTDIDSGELTSSVSDADATAPNYSFLNLTIGGVSDGTSEVLNIGGTNFDLGTNTTGQVTVGGTTFDVTVSNNGSTIRLVNSNSGNIPEADLENLIQGITYTNNATVPTSGDRTIDFTTSDGNNSSNTVTSTISTLFTNGNDYSEALTGTTGSDRISGYKGQDTLSGGGGDDDYYFAETSDGVDIITDFNTGDRLIFSDIIADETNYTDTGSDPIAQGYVLLTHYADVGTMVQIDFDGSAGSSTLLKDVVFIDDTDNNTNTSSLTASNFVF